MDGAAALGGAASDNIDRMSVNDARDVAVIQETTCVAAVAFG
ncbi:hypothetical protein ACFO1B_56475 [Dactylosporangium siamense]|uniref:Uncharacterized protein n=1 Tax=Dactylosporangium siamense TaxID=685454 RepID=A0A919UGP3_9ACTN|nr:hypothetical protein [Dactylosporangium siamense]GIG49888.1 hypothetical protein Dsi01nite_079290 [Dactylosporangium siamense]